MSDWQPGGRGRRHPPATPERVERALREMARPIEVTTPTLAGFRCDDCDEWVSAKRAGRVRSTPPGRCGGCGGASFSPCVATVCNRCGTLVPDGDDHGEVCDAG